LGEGKLDKNTSIVITNASSGENLCLIQLIKLKYDVEAVAIVHNDQQKEIVSKYTS
jgi:NADPH:quinone reductase-like Zn-dependent oxidoreductase